MAFELLDYQILSILIVSIVILVAIFLTSSRLHLRSPSFKEFNDMVQLVFNNLNRRIKELDEKVNDISLKFETYVSSLDEFKGKSEEYEEKFRSLAEGVKDTLRAQVSIVKTLKAFDKKILDLSRKVRGRPFRGGMDVSVNQGYSADVNSFRIRSKDIELAKLTPTEMKVLRVLATSGPKTASEIREVIGKTREHSSRLMKKLFLEGYVERDTTTIPYVYKISEKIKESFEFSS